MPPDHHKRVLVVDDDYEIRSMLGKVLRARSLVVDEAENGSDAVDLLRENRYAVILLDLMMPVADGFSVLSAMQTEGVSTPPVVLVITGADPSVTDNLDAQHIHGIVRKPFDPDDLASLVVACSEIRSRNSLGTMALAMMSGAPLLDWLRRFTS